MSDYNIYDVFFLLLVIEACGLYFTKKSSITTSLDTTSLETTSLFYLSIGSLCYCTIPILLYFILKKTHKISSLNTSWNVASTLYGLIIGVLIFSEIYTQRQLYGMFLGCMGILLMNF